MENIKFLPKFARATAAELPTIPPPAMTMSAVSLVLELIMCEEVTTDILGRGVTSPRRRAWPHRALIITKVRITEEVERRLNLLSSLQ